MPTEVVPNPTILDLAVIVYSSSVLITFRLTNPFSNFAVKIPTVEALYANV